MHRREFIQSVGRAALAGGALTQSGWSSIDALAANPGAAQWPVAIFTKVFQQHSYDQLADVVAQIGADGIEAPVRRGGHIEPQQIGQELPKMIASLAKVQKRVLLAATDITSVGETTTIVLKSLRDNGVMHYRTGYYRYNDAAPRLEQVRRFTDQAKALADLNQQIGIVGVYQNHAGDGFLGNVIWDLAMLLEPVDPRWLGVALDLRHLRAEIGVSWRAMIELIRPHVATVFAKNSTWMVDGKPKLINVPLGDGLVDRDMFRRVWRTITEPAPLSVHVEYLGQDSLKVGETAPMIAACARDVALFRTWISGEAP